MNWTNRFSMTVTLAMALLACDSFHEDMEPEGSEQLALKANISALPNTDVYIDLKQSIRTSENIKFEIHTAPQKGTATISTEAILHYQPLTNFTSGTDLIALNLINSAGAIMDTDSIVISMVNSADSLPCFNGALSDQYYTIENQPVMLSPVTNDGFCEEDLSEAVLCFLPGPQNGTLELVGHLAYRYTPSDGFTGTDSWMYELKLTDHEGNNTTSLAQITVQVQAATANSCDSLLREPKFYSLQKPHPRQHPRVNSYILDGLLGIGDCSDPASEMTILRIADQGASAEVLPGGSIEYWPSWPNGQQNISSDTIIYEIKLPADSIVNMAIISFYPWDENCTAQTDATADVFNLYVEESTNGTSQEPFVLVVAQNDTHCYGYELSITSAPAIGVAEVVFISDPRDITGFEYMAIHYYYREGEFTNDFINTQFQYRICENGHCDMASVEVTVRYCGTDCDTD